MRFGVVAKWSPIGHGGFWDAIEGGKAVAIGGFEGCGDVAFSIGFALDDEATVDHAAVVARGKATAHGLDGIDGRGGTQDL